MKKRNLLTILAISTLFSFNNVNAANTCPEGETLQTNYYMFLSYASGSGDGAGYLGDNGLIASNGGTFNQYTGAYKYQDLKGVTIVGEGKVAIGSSSANYNMGVGENAVNWTVRDYWKKWYNAHENKNAGTYIYTSGNDHYFMHAQNGMWFVFDATFSSASQQAGGNESTVANIIDSRGYDDLVNHGTILPSTKITPPSNKGTSSDTILLWKVNRATKEEDIPSTATGVAYPSTSTWKNLYSPAAYYVQYCAKANETPSTYTVSYDGNSKDATNVPRPSAKTNVGTAVTITSDTPSRKGYTFLGWARKSDATKADDTYKPGTSNYTGQDGSITLYAIWKNDATGTVDNPKTGVSSHIIAFASVTLIGAAGLLIARKKGLFRQL